MPRKPARPELAEVLRILRAEEAYLRSQGITALWVFGSVARGDARRGSDVDLAFSATHATHPSLLSIIGIELRLAELLNCPVDLGEREALKPAAAASAINDFVQVF